MIRPRQGRKPYEVYQISGSPGGIHKCWRVVIHCRGEEAALKLAKAKRAEWVKTSRAWGGGRVARLRVDPKSVPKSMRFPGLQICPHRAVVIASRKFRDCSGKERVIYLCYPYDIAGGSLPTFAEAMEKCRKGQGVLNKLSLDECRAGWQRHKPANLKRKRGESLCDALLSFAAFKDGFCTKQEMAKLNHAYDRAS